MPTWLSQLTERSSAFIPHGHCYLWIPSLLWLHVISDLLIGIAYVGISIILYLFVRKIRLPFSPIFIAFGLFIGLCGITHFMAIWTVWNPDYWLDGMIKAATAAASVATAIGLYFIRPQVEEVVHTARLSEERRIQLESTNAELEVLYNKIKEQDELKTQFFANISHELRTPLALILGPAERMLKTSTLDAEQRRQLESISRNGKTLLRQVNDLLDVAKLEEGEMKLRYSRVDLAPWFRRICSQFELSAEHRGIAFRVEAPETLPCEVDADKLERVLVNLLSNAFKFTPQGGAITAQLRGDVDELSLTVSDSGPGIEADQQGSIFERFRQADGSSTRRYGGTGLGLAIVKDFAELHHGKVYLSSNEGEGASFSVHLPRYAPAGTTISQLRQDTALNEVIVDTALQELEDMEAAPPSEQALATDPARPTVLVVEDTREMSDFIVEVLREHYNVMTASDGREGLEKAVAMPPDLVITDVMMPRMSGDQLLAALRGRRQLDTVPVLLLTAKADDDLRLRLLRSGAQDYVTKPFLSQELLARAANLIATKRAGDALRSELNSVSHDLESLAAELALRHRQLENALQATEVAREHAERASEVKSHFLAMISHEMRTPLSTIHMNAQLLARDPHSQSSEAFRTQLSRTIRATQQLTTLIEGLLEYIRVESGRVAVQPRMVDAAELMQQVIDTAQLQAAPEVELALRAPEPAMEPFVTDPRLLQVILSNLVSNALKFTQRGSVTLSYGQADAWRRFEVKDTGIGIPEQDLPRIFIPFEQLEPIQRKSIPGVGLGLAVTKEIVEALGGKIEVESEPGSGSTFRVLLPAEYKSSTPQH